MIGKAVETKRRYCHEVGRSVTRYGFYLDTIVKVVHTVKRYCREVYTGGKAVWSRSQYRRLGDIDGRPVW